MHLSLSFSVFGYGLNLELGEVDEDEAEAVAADQVAEVVRLPFGFSSPVLEASCAGDDDLDIDDD